MTTTIQLLIRNARKKRLEGNIMEAEKLYLEAMEQMETTNGPTDFFSLMSFEEEVHTMIYQIYYSRHDNLNSENYTQS